MLDLSRAVVVTPPALTGPERKAVEILVEDVARRSGIRWKVLSPWPAEPVPVVAVGSSSAAKAFTGPFAEFFGDGTRPRPAEGYRIRTETKGPAVLVAGNDARGVLFGVGRLLRELRTTEGRVLPPFEFQLETDPRYPLYDAIAVDRGASLDALDVPLNDRLWLRDQSARLKSLDAEADRIRGIEAIIHRTDPGPGGFYDDLGNLRLQPHMVRARDYSG